MLDRPNIPRVVNVWGPGELEAYRERARQNEQNTGTVFDFTKPERSKSIDGYDIHGNYDPYLNFGSADCDEGNGL